MTELRTRKPTGRAPWPFLLLEGVEKAGKTFAALALSGSDKVGRTFAFDLGEGSLDEYAALGPFEVVDHDGTYRDLLAQLQAAVAVPMEDGKPNVIVIDSMTALWSALVDEAQASARKSKAGQRLLANDPEAEVPVTMDKWNVAKRKWRKVVDLLMSYEGIAIVTARGKEVAEVENGRPVEGHKTWKVEAEKSLTFDASCIVRMTGPRVAHLVGVRSLVVQVPEGKTLPIPGFTVEDLVFTKLGLNAGNTAARNVTHAVSEPAESDEKWVEEWGTKVAFGANTEDELKALWQEAVEAHTDGLISDANRLRCSALLTKALEVLRSGPAGSEAPQEAPQEAAEAPEQAEATTAAPEAAQEPEQAPTTAEAEGQAALTALAEAGMIGDGQSEEAETFTRTPLRKGLATALEDKGEIDAVCQEAYGKPFDACTTAELRTLLTKAA